MADRDDAAGVAALAACEAIILALLERQILDGETIRESLEDARQAACESHPEMSAWLRRAMDTLVQQTYTIEVKIEKK